MKNTIKCAHCGAQIIFDRGVPVIECKYCDSMMVIELNHSEKLTIDNNQSINLTGANTLKEEIKLRTITPNDRFKARYELGDIAQRGELWVTDAELLFKPNSNNVGEKTIRYIPIAEIESISKFNSCYWNGDGILVELNDGFCVAMHVKSSVCNDIVEDVRKKITTKEEILTTYPSFDYSKYNGAKKVSEIKEYKKSIWLKATSTIALILIYFEVEYYQLNHIKGVASALGPNGNLLILAFTLLGLGIAGYKIKSSFI